MHSNSSSTLIYDITVLIVEKRLFHSFHTKGLESFLFWSRSLLVMGNSPRWESGPLHCVARVGSGAAASTYLCSTIVVSITSVQNFDREYA